MAFCSSCGAKVEDGVQFCSKCGKPIGGVSNEPTPGAQQQSAGGQTQSIMADEKYCFSCGSVIKKAAEVCPKCGVNQNSRSSINAIDVYCSSCGKSIKKAASICPFCGVKTESQDVSGGGAEYPPGYVPKNWLTALLLLIFLGAFGAHRFYVGKIGTGILTLLISLCTMFMGSIVWFIIDLVYICTGKFTDKQGYLLKKT